MVVNDIHEEEQEFIVSKQQDDMDSATIPTPKIQCPNKNWTNSSFTFS